MKPFFTYYGGKYRAAPRYPKPAHRRIVEPFAGSAGYSTRYPDRDVVLIDLDERICAVWEYLINASESDIMRLPDIDSGQSVDDLSLSSSEKMVIGFWLNKGAAGPCKKPSSWMRKGTHSNSFWGPSIRERLASQVGLIRHWKIINGSYADYEFGESTYFVDPPYQQMGVHYKHGAQKIDFQKLGDWCKSRVGQVIVCENTGADWLPFAHFMDAKATESKTGGKVSREAIWVKETPPNP